MSYIEKANPINGDNSRRGDFAPKPSSTENGDKSYRKPPITLTVPRTREDSPTSTPRFGRNAACVRPRKAVTPIPEPTWRDATPTSSY